MSSVTSFLRQYLTDAELWLLLPLAGSVVMAVACFLVLNAAIDEKGSVTEAEKQELKQRIREEGRKVVQRAEEKRLKDQQAIADRLREQQQQQQPALQEQSEAEQEATAAAATEQQGAERSVQADAAVSEDEDTQASAGSELRQRKGRTAAAARVDDGSSDADWEMVDSDELERAAQPGFEMPPQLQQDLDASIASIHSEPAAGHQPSHTAAVMLRSLHTSPLTAAVVCYAAAACCCRSRHGHCPSRRPPPDQRVPLAHGQRVCSRRWETRRVVCSVVSITAKVSSERHSGSARGPADVAEAAVHRRLQPGRQHAGSRRLFPPRHAQLAAARQLRCGSPDLISLWQRGFLAVHCAVLPVYAGERLPCPSAFLSV